jgi:type IV secretory pathway VirB9-like protein
MKNALHPGLLYAILVACCPLAALADEPSSTPPTLVEGQTTRYPYGLATDPTINCGPQFFCDFELAPQEVLTGVAVADPAWKTDRLQSGSASAQVTHLLVWPGNWNDESSLFVTTDRRKYVLRLTADRSRPITPTVTFYFPGGDPVRYRDTTTLPAIGSGALPPASFDPSRLNLAYRVQRDRYAPTLVFDDSVHTYLLWKGRRPPEAPVVVAFDESDQPSVLAPHVIGDWYVLDAVVPKLQLRKGNKTVTISNEALDR